jgi:uncharacterized membrane protein
MSGNKEIPDDDAMEKTIGTILRYGVVLAAAIVLFGGIIYLIKYGMMLPDYAKFTNPPDSMKGIKGILSHVLRLESQGLILLGVLVLIATPIVRVLFSALAFFRQRDYLYSIFTLIVLAILLFGFLRGII